MLPSIGARGAKIHPIRKDQFRHRPQTVCREERAQ